MIKVGTEKDYSNSCISAEHLKNHYPEKVNFQNISYICRNTRNGEIKCFSYRI